jgi:prepilin-type N-terminal cleavage/methylation domain-containing protein
MKKKRGFSVVEMLVAIAITALILVLSLQMGRSSIQRSTFTAAINQFVADFNYARLLATRENRCVAFDFNNDGATYTIRVLRGVGLDPQDADNYRSQKTGSPMDGEACFSGATDFAINSMGVIRQYPVDPNSNPITVTLNFYKAKKGTESTTLVKYYQKTITIFPTGGIKIEDTKD